MLARQSEIRYKNGKADPCGRLPILYISLESERNKRPENRQCSPPAENKKSARRDSNSPNVGKATKIKEERTLSKVCLQVVYNL